MDKSVTPAPRAARGPAWGFLALAMLACLAFVRLGMWQWHKGQVREAQWQAFAHGADGLVDLDVANRADIPEFQAVRVGGTLDGSHQFLLDNRSYRGRPGYEVLTPLLRQGAAALLVDRGWVPFTGSRRVLPDVRIAAAGTLLLRGRLAPLPSPGLAMGHAPPADGPWPKVTAFPDMADLAAAFGAPLDPRILLLRPDQPFGYVRDWQPPGLAPLRHFSYAIQWWSFALLAVFLWALLTYRNRRTAVKT